MEVRWPTLHEASRGILLLYGEPDPPGVSCPDSKWGPCIFVPSDLLPVHASAEEAERQGQVTMSLRFTRHVGVANECKYTFVPRGDGWVAWAMDGGRPVRKYPSEEES